MEKYGTVPPRFTKDWWGHYWHYYKLHIIFGLIMLIAVIYLVVGLVNKVEYDLNIEIVTEDGLLTPDTTEMFKEKTKSLANDVTGDNEIQIEYQNELYSSAIEKNMNYIQQNNALITRIMAEVELAEKQIYIVNRTTADYLVDFECMLPVKSWSEDALDKSIYKEVFFSLEGNAEFSKMGFDTSNLYIGVIELRDKVKDDEALRAKQENAKYVAGELIKE